MSNELNNVNYDEVVKEMLLSSIESIIKLNTKVATLLRSHVEDEETQVKLNELDKKIMNIVFIIYPAREFARKYLTEQHAEYLYILDFVEKKYELAQVTAQLLK